VPAGAGRAADAGFQYLGIVKFPGLEPLLGNALTGMPTGGRWRLKSIFGICG
jgi:hypothetical protein